ncbi:inositol hexakisphosphate-domain-containing protein [Cantharellus anzutake]|uniref:inositol hexakisphosphate-domain-containing protein n=1 Tax=Cantharellus anzutake TaxID=1750568 RepID=UPI0019056B5B|nr:inositol hexakisphosphate-domain-containing protein [Cantharellus anzutake]KAF8340378.1 inositol hexakisphosphate-domain-containing protein [Cantharellus anzutake]
MSKLQRIDLIIKARNGSVLSRGSILKTDHYPTGRALNLDVTITGAPNFRSPRVGSLNVFGVAQPRINGLKAVLSVLGCRPAYLNSSLKARMPNPSGSATPLLPDIPSPPTHSPSATPPNCSRCVFFSTREEPVVYLSGQPFVLRDASDPTEALSLSVRAENLEAIESRLKADILAEAAKFGGLILTHYEGVGSEEGILPTWTAVDPSSVLTSREVWDQLKGEGWNVEYHRIPISPDRPIEDNYLDAYLNVIISTDPRHTSLVFSCGMGVVRTTFAMVAASIIRRKQLLNTGLPDPFFATPGTNASGGDIMPMDESAPTLIPTPQAAAGLEKANAEQEMQKALLRLTFIIQQNIQQTAAQRSQSAIEVLLSQPSLLDSLSRAVRGNYGIILSLLGCLDNGAFAKRLVDAVVDSCDHVVNLREVVLDRRIHYSVTTTNNERRSDYLMKAGKALEKYYFLIAFGSYVERAGLNDTHETFYDWLKARVEIWNQVTFLRKASLSAFAPIANLSAITRSGSAAPSQEQDVLGREGGILAQPSGTKVLGDEWTDHVIKNRSGIILRPSTLLKSDLWKSESQKVTSTSAVRGTINFRNIAGTNIYALGQPAVEAIDAVRDRIMEDHQGSTLIIWINLREEPIVYINGSPYCLRRENFSLRNMKDYGGISASRMEILEERLRNDVIAELQSFDDRVLLHTENPSGAVVPMWEHVQAADVADLRTVMESKRHAGPVEMSFVRIPVTAERPPDASDINELLALMLQIDHEQTPIVLNCQLGRGRSTITSIFVYLIQRWLKTRRARSASNAGRGEDDDIFIKRQSRIPSYQVINSLLRLLRNGVRIKEDVDVAIDKVCSGWLTLQLSSWQGCQCGEVYNIRDAIEDCRLNAEQATNDQDKRLYAQQGMSNLRRYFLLIIFQAYLRSVQPDTLRSYDTFETFVKNRPVFRTLEKELLSNPTNALKPLERIEVSEDFASPDEERIIVANRSGSVLSASTMLKSDLFTNLQKMSLPERVVGAPNFRRLPLILFGDVSSLSPSQSQLVVCGSGMPTVEGMRHVLRLVQATQKGPNCVSWISLREEPVVYVAGRPHVLRTVDRPLQNVEATGIATDVVEQMEKALKKDVQGELRRNQGKILLHDELEGSPGNYEITPLYETATENEIMTPRDVFELIMSEGYKVDYGRVAITDEQAPLPEALDQIIQRVEAALKNAMHLVFNCQMGYATFKSRGRTTTGMVAAVLIATVAARDVTLDPVDDDDQEDAADLAMYDRYDGYEEKAYLNGEYKTILRLVGILSHGKIAKRLCDRAVDSVDSVQNLRRAIFDYKMKLNALDQSSSKYRSVFDIACNYLYRYGTLIVLTNYLIERQAHQFAGQDQSFPVWLREHREITNLLGRRTLE